jgi:hypothetical protein
MRQLKKTTWPYKLTLSEFDYTEHEKFVDRYPSIKLCVLVRNDNWSDWKKQYGHDVYFTKESDLVLYRLSAQ